LRFPIPAIGLRGSKLPGGLLEGAPPTRRCEVEAGENVSPRLEFSRGSCAEYSGSGVLFALSGVRRTGSTTVR
jgi:hypothetical protein